MDDNRRPTQGSGTAAVGGGVDPTAPAGGDWQLEPEIRSKVVNKILETMRMHLPGGLNELQENAVQLEEKMYTAATSQVDYLRKIALKLLVIEAETQQAPGIAQVIPNQNNRGQASEDSTAETGHAGAGDWQEEIYQMIRSLKDQHFAELNEMFNELSETLQQVDSITPRPVPPERYERMKGFKTMFGHILQVLLISKSDIQPGLRDKVPLLEKHIIKILSVKRRSQQPPTTGQAHDSNISRQHQQPHQSLQQHGSHTDPQASLSSMSTGLQSSTAAGIRRHVPAPPATNFGVRTQRNGANIQRQAGSNSEMQVTLNAQLRAGSRSSMLSRLSGQRKHIIKRRWRETF